MENGARALPAILGQRAGKSLKATRPSEITSAERRIRNKGFGLVHSLQGAGMSLRAPERKVNYLK